MMTWEWLATVLVVWFIVAVPLGMLVGSWLGQREGRRE